MASDSTSKVSSTVLSSTGRIRELFKKYGKVALGVHLTVYFTCWAGCYMAITNHVDVRGMLAQYGLLSGKSYDEAAEEMADKAKQAAADQSWMDRMLTGSPIALAFLCNKALFPVRTPMTLGLTPVVARLLRVKAAQMPVP